MQDTKARHVTRRIAIEGKPSTVAVSQDKRPLIFLNGEGKVRVRDAETVEFLREMAWVCIRCQKWRLA